MEIARLVAMANQIAAFFESLPQRDEAIKGVAQHLRNFWDPRMRKQLIAHVMEGGDSGLSRLAREAVLILHSEIQSKPSP
jgi:formate dehydrogenase subunit delta